MLKYETVFEYIQQLIVRGVIKPGGRVPSIRKLARQLDLSSITVQHAYDLLEVKGLIEARPRAGFFVPVRPPSSDEHKSSLWSLDEQVRPATVADATYATMSLWHRRKLIGFGGINPHWAIPRTDELHRQLRYISRRSQTSHGSQDPPEGNLAIREAVGRRLADRGLVVHSRDVVVAGTGMQGFEICLDHLTNSGDTILIDTPSYLPLLAAIQRKGLLVLEIYSHPIHGMDPDQLSYLMSNHRVRACVFSPLNHFPTGVSLSKDSMMKVVQIAEAHRVPVIEIDLFSDLAHGETPQAPLTSYATRGQFYLFGSFLPTLGPDFGVGWIVAPGAGASIMERKFQNNLSFGDSLTQRAIGEYMKDRQFERDLRKQKQAMMSRVRQGAHLASGLFPSSFTVTHPSGGYMCWIRGPLSFDAMEASRLALERDLSLAGGPMFSPSGGFPNFLALNLSVPWNTEAVDAMHRVAALVQELSGLRRAN